MCDAEEEEQVEKGHTDGLNGWNARGLRAKDFGESAITCPVGHNIML